MGFDESKTIELDMDWFIKATCGLAYLGLDYIYFRPRVGIVITNTLKKKKPGVDQLVLSIIGHFPGKPGKISTWKV